MACVREASRWAFAWWPEERIQERIEKVIKMLGCRHWTKLTEEEKGVFLLRGPVHGAKAASSKEAQTATPD